VILLPAHTPQAVTIEDKHSSKEMMIITYSCGLHSDRDMVVLEAGEKGREEMGGH